MPQHFLDDADLLDRALGAVVDDHFAGCATCQAAADEVLAAIGLLAASLPQPAVPARGRVRLLAATAPAMRSHASRLAQLLRWSEADALRTLVALEDDVLAWESHGPAISHHRLAGPDKIAGLLRISAGAQFPDHRHVGDEHLLVLQGSCVDSLGAQLGPGDHLHRTAGTRHALTVHPGPALIVAYSSAGLVFAQP